MITDQILTTQGEATNPAGRLFPQRIIPSPDFVSQQEKIWEQLSSNKLFYSRKTFPSSHQLEYVRSLMNPISGELELRSFARDVVENAVQKLIEEVNKDEKLRERLNLRGKIRFESHTNLGLATSVSVDTMQQLSLNELSISDEDALLTIDKDMVREDDKARNNDQKTNKPASLKPALQARGKGGRADQFLHIQIDGWTKHSGGHSRI